MIEILIVILLFLLALNLSTVAAQTALLKVSLPRLLLLHEQEGWEVEKSVSLLQVSLQAQASLNLARLLWRFALGALIFYAILQLQPPYALLIAAVVLLVSALVLYILELSVQA
ncbi:MAG: hypothetical protein ACWGO1_07715, partial [Anaerolineales bacterium]